jgi:hypothetical protein
MADPQVMAVLQERWEAVEQAIAIHESWLDKASSSARMRLLWCLARSLRSFAQDHFRYFHQGFGSGSLEESALYPPPHVLTTILYQVSDDLEVIRKAATDELVSGDSDEATLARQRGDELVGEALRPAAQFGISNPIPITYFQKSAAIRVIPYDERFGGKGRSTIALIGIPFSTVQLARDYLATPHEVGHFVYWNGRIQDRAMWEAVREAIDRSAVPEWIRPWTEEIFADVYGCLLAGPVIALDFQDLQLLESARSFIQDDGQHPTPVVRPFIYSHTLHRMGLGNWADSLDARWRAAVAQRGSPSQIFLQRSPLSGFLSSAVSDLIDFLGYYRVPVVQARQAIRSVVDIIFGLLSETNFGNNWWAEFDYASYTKEVVEDYTNLEKLYPAFTEYLNALIPGESQVAARECDPEDIWQTWFSQFGPGASGTAEAAVPVAQWMPVWIADGWATRGPQGLWE